MIKNFITFWIKIPKTKTFSLSSIIRIHSRTETLEHTTAVPAVVPGRVNSGLSFSFFDVSSVTDDYCAFEFIRRGVDGKQLMRF